jgi:hypothetical protein
MLGLRSDGSVVGWGRNDSSQCNPPALPAGISYVEIASGDDLSVARRSDGNVVAWGLNIAGSLAVPALPAGTAYVSISAGGLSGMARRSDGVVVNWGGPVVLYPGVPVAPAGSVLVDGMITGNSNSVFRIESCTTGTIYCTAGITTNGCSATMSASGLASASAPSGFVLACQNVEGQKLGLILYGISGPRATEWAPGSTSLLCVEPPIRRMTAQGSGGSIGTCTGALSSDWLAFVSAHPGTLGTPLMPGATFYAQGWFRDLPAPGGTSLSDAIVWALAP